MNSKNYTIGLDIGTASVGWAVLDENFTLVQGKKKITTIAPDGTIQKKQSRTNLWGVRLFDSAEVAEYRRTNRGMRRRIARRKKRLEYLRCIFEQAILAIDDSFFIRMDESFFQNDDDANKTITTKYPLFNGKLGSGESYEDEVAYYEAYPTIYHLRKRLVEDASQADLRLVYLALHHILKFRGHFTNQGQTFNLQNIDLAKNLLELLHQYELARQDSFDFKFDDNKHAEANAILTDRTKSKSWKAFQLTNLFSVLNVDEYFSTYEQKTEKQTEKFLKNVDGQLKALFTAIVGNGIDVSKIFNKEEYKPSAERNFKKSGDFKYTNENFEKELAEIEADITPEEFEVLLTGKKVYESIILSTILTEDTLAASMVAKYELHKAQLAELKKFTKSISEKLFKHLFKENGIYSKFIQGEGNPAKKTAREDFYKEIKKAFESEFAELKFPKDEKEFDFSKTVFTPEQEAFLRSINKAMQRDTYLPKQRMSDNGAIPYQAHEHELVEIIKNQSAYYDFLGEVVESEREQEDGSFEKITEYKIQTLFKFRIPYYIGTLATARDADGQFTYAKNAWVVRKSDNKLTPWNFHDVIDKEASAANFIERMTNFCTHLPSERVLPDKSLLYQEFKIYNELISSGYYNNQTKIYFSPEFRQKIVSNLFKETKKVSAKKMIEFLNAELGLSLLHPRQLFGIDTAVNSPCYNNSFSTYHDLINAGIPPAHINDYRDRFEEIIKWQTIFEDKKLLKKTIRTKNEQEWNNFLTDTQVNKLAKQHYTGWGRLSKKLLNGIQATNGKTIIQNLKEEKFNNFMRLLEDKSIAEKLKDAQTEGMEEGQLSYHIVADLAGSPALKKGIWQSLKVIKELEDYLGKENISKIVIEIAREHKTGRTQTRQKKIENFYKTFKEKTGEELSANLQKEFKEVNDPKLFDNEKFFLYFVQNGKCMYSGTPLTSPFRLQEYEVDHIIPQTYIKDDSFDNKVLVLKKENQNKGGNVPNRSIINRMSNFWELLARNGQVSPRKLKNLKMGSITDEQKKSFINRQLVETRQITKHVAHILSEHFKDTKIEVLTPKAGLISQFRQGVVYVEKKEFKHESALATRLHFEADNKVYLPTGEIIEGHYSNANFVKVHFHAGFEKNRDLNDYHHAHDAYLAAVVANYIYGTRPDLKKAWIHGQYKRKLSRETGKFGNQRKDWHKQLLSDMKNDTWIYWDAKTGDVLQEFNRDEVLSRIRSYLELRNINVVKKTEINSGKFGDNSILKKDPTAKNSAVGLKSNLDPRRYGRAKSQNSALTVVAKDQKGIIKPFSISAMNLERYLKADDKLTFLREIDPSAKISEIVMAQIPKYTQYILPNGASRLLASDKEAQTATQLPMMELAGKDSSEEKFQSTYDILANFIKKNHLFAEAKLELLDGTIKNHFQNSDAPAKLKILSELLRVTNGSNHGLEALSKAGLGTKEQRLTSKNNTITNDTTMVHKSITGLYETRIKI